MTLTKSDIAKTIHSHYGFFNARYGEKQKAKREEDTLGLGKI